MAYPSAAVTTSGVNSIASLTAKGVTGTLEALIAANPATADPTVAPTLATSGTGNTLPTATYYIRVSETNAFGETKSIAAAASQAVTLGAALVVTFQTLKTGNTARNVYAGTASDYSDSKLVASGVTAGTYSITAPLPTNSYAVAPPTVNTTGLTFVDANGKTINKALELLRSFEKGNGQTAYDYLRRVVTNFTSGQPVNFQAEMMKLNHARSVFAMLHQLCLDIGTVVDANAGTLTTADWGAGLKKGVRTQP